MDIGISVHDAELLAYSVDAKAQEIRLQVVFRNEVQDEQVEVRFTGVVGYRFMHDNFMTILFGIDETDPVSIYDDYPDEFEEGQQYCWPGVWNQGREAALTYLAAHQVKGYAVTSSLGMNGWVLAREMAKRSIIQSEGF